VIGEEAAAFEVEGAASDEAVIAAIGQAGYETAHTS
jgi:hypothetical protein